MAVMRESSYRKEYLAILKTCSDFGFSDTDDVPLSAIVRSAFQTLTHEQAGAPVAVPAPSLSAIEPMRDLTEDDMRTIEQIVQERHGSVAVPAAREGEKPVSETDAIERMFGLSEILRDGNAERERVHRRAYEIVKALAAHWGDDVFRCDHAGLLAMIQEKLSGPAAPPTPEMTDAAEMLWVVLANVSGGDWTQQTPEWQEAAARWRDNYFAAVRSAASSASENRAESKWPRTEFLHCVLIENRDGNLWGDMLMELGEAINDEIDGTAGTKKYSFWIGEARELAATDGIGWPGVLRLMGEAIALGAVDPVQPNSGEPSTRVASSTSDGDSASSSASPATDREP